MVFSTQAMQHNIANLYAHIFFFLRNTIGWYMRKSIKRALSSLKEDFYHRFATEVSDIKQISQAISREAQHGSHSEARYTMMLVEKLEEEAVIGRQNRERDEAERKYEQQKDAEERARDREEYRVLILEKPKRIGDLHQFIGESARTVLLPIASVYVSERTRERDIQSSNAMNSWAKSRSFALIRYHRVEKPYIRTNSGLLLFPFTGQRYQQDISPPSKWKRNY